MANPAAAPRPPLAHLREAMCEATVAGVELRELPFLAQVDLRVDPLGAEARRIETAVALPLPMLPNTFAAGGRRQVLWLGPDEWLIVGPPDTAPDIEAALREAIADGFGAVVDVSANRAVLELAGPAAREVLSTCCSLDLHPRVFTAGHCAQTLLAKAQVILQQVDDRPAYRLFVRPSFGAYVMGWLAAGARSVAN